MVLRQWHALPLPDEKVPVWNPTVAARQRIPDADGLDTGDREWLLAWCDELEPQIAALTAAQPHVLAHGDARVGKLLRRGDGPVEWCDFDSTRFDPPHVDLAAAAVANIWFPDRHRGHEALARACGQDVTDDPNLACLPLRTRAGLRHRRRGAVAFCPRRRRRIPPATPRYQTPRPHHPLDPIRLPRPITIGLAKA